MDNASMCPWRTREIFDIGFRHLPGAIDDEMGGQRLYMFRAAAERENGDQEHVGC
jgi:hypothetical protein